MRETDVHATGKRGFYAACYEAGLIDLVEEDGRRCTFLRLFYCLEARGRRFESCRPDQLNKSLIYCDCFSETLQRYL